MKKLSDYFYFNSKKQSHSSEHFDYIMIEIIDDVVKKEKFFMTDTIYYLRDYGLQKRI